MGSLKLELKKRLKNDLEIMQCGGRDLEEIQTHEGPRSEDEISFFAALEALEAIDDDDVNTIEAARSQAEDIAGMSKHSISSEFPLDIIEPPLDFPGENLFSSNAPEFQELSETEDEIDQLDSELQLELERLAKVLEDFF